MRSNDRTDPVSFVETALNANPTPAQRALIEAARDAIVPCTTLVKLPGPTEPQEMIEAAIWLGLFYCFVKTAHPPFVAIKVSDEMDRASAQQLFRSAIQDSDFPEHLIRSSSGRLVFVTSFEQAQDLENLVAMVPYGHLTKREEWFLHASKPYLTLRVS